MKRQPRIFVLLPVHNRRATTEKFIRCLTAQTYANWHLVLIDDGSKDGTEDMARALVPSLTVIRGRGNWWWGGALQQGYDWLAREKPPSDDLVFINNDDTEIDASFLANAVNAVKPRSLLLAQLYDQAGHLLEAGVQWDWRNLTATAVTDPTLINCFSTRGLFLQVGDFMEIGGFHPFLLPHYLSDYEFTLRAKSKGFALITKSDVFLRYDDSLTGNHGIGGTTIFKAWRRLFSRRSSSNPFYWTSFILLACPARYMPINLLRTWWSVFLPIREKVYPLWFPVRYFLGRVKRKVFKILKLQKI